MVVSHDLTEFLHGEGGFVRHLKIGYVASYRQGFIGGSLCMSAFVLIFVWPGVRCSG